MRLTKSQLSAIVWIIGASVTVAAVAAWYSQRATTNQPLTGYSFFPLLGLLAFSLMWTHYAGGALRRYFGFEKPALSRYFKVTSGVILACILLHPGILWLGLYRDGYGLPPISHLLVYTDNSLLSSACCKSLKEPIKSSILLLVGMLLLLLLVIFKLYYRL